MIKLLKIALALAVALPVYAEEPIAIDWNATAADIRDRERSEPQDASDKRITYEAKFKGEQYHLEYLFNDEGALVNVLYYRSFAPDGEDCLAEYQRIRNAYLTDHGKAQSKTALDDAVVAQYAKGHGCKAVAEGKLTTNSEWAVDDNTNVSVLLSVWKGQPYVGISSTPRC